MLFPSISPSAIFLLITSTSLVQAANLSIHINPPQHFALNPSTLPSSTHAQISGKNHLQDVLIRSDNTFHLSEVPAGSYLLDVFCRDYFFEPLRVDVSVDGSGEKVQAWQTFRGNEWDNKGESRAEGDGKEIVKIGVNVLGPKQYYQQREGFSVLSFLKSPMILMALFSMAMIFGMPYLLENMDPESRAEFEEMQKSSPLSGVTGAATNPSSITNFDFASWASGRSGASAPAGSQPEPKQVQQGGQKSEGGKRRKG